MKKDYPDPPKKYPKSYDFSLSRLIKEWEDGKVWEKYYSQANFFAPCRLKQEDEDKLFFGNINTSTEMVKEAKKNKNKITHPFPEPRHHRVTESKKKYKRKDFHVLTWDVPNDLEVDIIEYEIKEK